MKKKLFVLLTALALVNVSYAEKVVIKGSDTLGAKLVPQLAEAYKVSNPETTFEIAAEGSSTGIAAVIDGTADLGMSSRPAKPKEVSAALAKGVKMKPTIVAFDGIGIIVNKDNPISSLSLKQVEEIFTGDVTDWNTVGGNSGTISMYTRNTSSGTYSDFKKMAMSKRDYAGAAQKMAGNEQIASEVAKNPLGIGYVGMAYLKTPGIKVVKIDGVLPSMETVREQQYPIARPTFFYSNGAPSAKAQKFVDFLFSSKGSEIVKQVGFVPSK
ncbi:MAG: phosphate ABC transporter substrate-binding protein [Verrucomicrobiota bacterium]